MAVMHEEPDLPGRGQSEMGGSRREPIEWPGIAAPLESERNRPDEALHSMMAQWAAEIAALRDRVETLEHRTTAQRGDMEQAFELVQSELIQVRDAARIAERHEEMIAKLREENVHGAASLQRINEEQILILNQLMGRIGGIQGDLVQQRGRIKNLLIAVGATALAIVAVIALLMGLYFL